MLITMYSYKATSDCQQCCCYFIACTTEAEGLPSLKHSLCATHWVQGLEKGIYLQLLLSLLFVSFTHSIYIQQYNLYGDSSKCRHESLRFSVLNKITTVSNKSLELEKIIHDQCFFHVRNSISLLAWTQNSSSVHIASIDNKYHKLNEVVNDNFRHPQFPLLLMKGSGALT